MNQFLQALAYLTIMLTLGLAAAFLGYKITTP
jgi:fluoride ion exporter CrcB/FEX